MIKTIIDNECNRLKSHGYNYELQTVSVGVNSTQKQLYLGNDIYVLTGIRMSQEDVLGDLNTLVMSCPSEELSLTQQHISQLGTSIVKVFRHYINIYSFYRNTDNVVYGMSDAESIREMVAMLKNWKYRITYFTMVRGRMVLTSAVLTAEQFYEISNYSAYSTNMTLSRTEWMNYRFGYLKNGYQIIKQNINIEDLANADMNTLYEYMQVSSGRRIERDILTFELEFVRIIPIKQ